MLNQIFTNQTADGSSEVFKLPPAYTYAQVWVVDNFGGGTVTLEVLAPDGTTWVPTSHTFTSNGVVVIDKAYSMRLDLSGATTPSLNAWVEYDVDARERARG